MGVRTRSATPGTLLCLAATALLAVVSFNTPLLKSLYFLEANFSEGAYSGQLRLGTLGYCLNDVCQGPQVGYEFNPNELFGISLFNIPTAISKYLTYTLILHIIALAFALASTIFGALSHISTLSVWCFPTCFASIASSVSLLALVFDLVIFYIAKARIDDVQGASASIGISVWLTLAAWLCAGLGGCAYGIGRCCVNNRGKRGGDDYAMAAGGQGPQTDGMRLQALRDEQLRKKEQGLPSFQELERTPLTQGRDEDKYLYEETTVPVQSTLGRNGSVVQGVGVGYGRRTPGQQGQQGQPGWGQQGQGGGAYGPGAYGAGSSQGLSRRGTTSTMGPGAAGVGAGGAGVEVPGQYGYYDDQNNYYDQGQYNDPYAQHQQQDPYAQHQQDPYGQQQQQDPYAQRDPYGYNAQGGGGYDQQQLQQHSYPPAAALTTMAMPQPAVTSSGRRTADPYAAHPQAGGYNRTPDPYAAGDISSDSHYSNPGPHVTHADPYDAYDDGLGAIGRAATITQHGQHREDYGASGQGSTSDYGATPNPYASAPGSAIHVPTPQHLTTRNQTSELLRSGVSPGPGEENRRSMGIANPDDQYAAGGGGGAAPPSYDHAAAGGSGSGYPREKSSYR